MRPRLLVFLFTLMGTMAMGQTPIQSSVDKLLAHPLMKGTVTAMAVLEAESGKKVFGFNEDYNLVPASNQKLITSGAAWRVLGPDWRFSTMMQLYGDCKDSLFTGEIVIIGSGDPTLGSHRFGPSSDPDSVLSHWTNFLQQQGIRVLRGRIHVYPLRYPGSPVGLTWEWSDLGGCFGQGQWPLNWQENCLNVTLDLDEKGYYFAADTFRLPWPVVLDPSTNKTREPEYVHLTPETPGYRIGAPANLPLPVALRVANPDPPAYMLDRWMESLQRANIRYEPQDKLTRPLPFVSADTIWSPPLREIITRVNAESRNLYAEALMRALGQARWLEPTIDSGIRVIKKWLTDLDLHHHSYWIYDGSGMSRHNALSPLLLAEMLAAIHQRPDVYEGFKETLSVPGRIGTLYGAFPNKVLKDKIWAKSGSLNRVRTLSGYLETKDGTLLSFSLLTNQFRGSTTEFNALAQQWLLALYYTPIKEQESK